MVAMVIEHNCYWYYCLYCRRHIYVYCYNSLTICAIQILAKQQEDNKVQTLCHMGKNVETIFLVRRSGRLCTVNI